MNHACTFAIFGVTGNLAREKLLPALYHLEQAGRLPPQMVVMGIGRRPWDTEQWRREVRELLPDKAKGGLDQAVLERNFSYPTPCALSRMVSRQTGFYWGTSGHSAQPVVVGSLGPGAERFSGYMDNTTFGRILHRLLDAR